MGHFIAIIKKGNICLGTLTEDICDDELIVEINGEVPVEGTITIEAAEISDIALEYKK